MKIVSGENMRTDAIERMKPNSRHTQSTDQIKIVERAQLGRQREVSLIQETETLLLKLHLIERNIISAVVSAAPGRATDSSQIAIVVISIETWSKLHVYRYCAVEDAHRSNRPREMARRESQRKWNHVRLLSLSTALLSVNYREGPHDYTSRGLSRKRL